MLYFINIANKTNKQKGEAQMENTTARTDRKKEYRVYRLILENGFENLTHITTFTHRYDAEEYCYTETENDLTILTVYN